MQDRSPDLVGKLNLEGQQQLCDAGACDGVEGNARFLAAPGSVSTDLDNGNLNYDKHDIVSAVSRLSTRLGLSYGDYGLFLRGNAYYDPVNVDFEETHPNTTFQPRHTDRPRSAAKEIAERAELLDAYVRGSVPFIGERTLDFRLGRQSVYWGESNFLVLNSLAVINPPQLNRLEVPGSNVDEIFTPVPMLRLTTKPMSNLDLELIYQFGWEPVEIEPAGTYFSTDDTVGTGGRFAHLSGKLPEDPQNQNRPFAPLSDTGSLIYRARDRKPEDGGQYGASLKYFTPDWGEGLQVGLYFLNYHSRLPVGSFTAAQDSSCRDAPEAFDATPALVLPFCLAGEPVPLDTAQYFLDYPEDIRMYGVSVVTTTGEWAWQFEYAYRPNVPVQVDALDLAYAALQPALPREDVPVPGVATIPGARHAAPDFIETRYRGHTVQPGQYIPGYERMRVGQLNLSTILLTPRNPFGSSFLLLLVETGLTHVLDFPSLDELQLEGPGTNNHFSPGIDGTGAGGQTDPLRSNETQQTDGFATQYSWGYRIYAELEYPDALFGYTLKPLLAFAHDVDGTAVGNGGNFIEGRQQLDLALMIREAELWSALIQYTRYSGAGEFNLLSDRDNLALSLTFNF